MDKPSKKRTAKRDQIFQTAEALFSRYGSRRVTVEELCREAGVSKMTFYKYFKNKKELVQSIKQAYMDEGFAEFDRIKALDIPYPDKIDRMTQWNVEFSTRINAEFIKEMVTIDDVVREAKRRFLNNIREAQADAEIRPDIDPELLWLVTQKLKELVVDGKWKEVSSDFGQYQRQVRNLLFYGLLTRSGVAGRTD